MPIPMPRVIQRLHIRKRPTKYTPRTMTEGPTVPVKRVRDRLEGVYRGS